MESIPQTTQDHLVSNLSFKLPQNGASYVTDKVQATFFPQGGDTYNPLTGQRILRFALSSSGYIDLSSLVFSMDFRNGPTHPATALVSGAHCLFTRARVLVSGTEVENVESHHIVTEMFHRLLGTEKKASVELMGFAGQTIAADTTKTIIFRPSILGICNQPLWIPPFMGSSGIVIELHLANGDQFLESGAGQSTTYSLSNVRALCDVFTLDPGLNNTYAAHVLAGKRSP